MLAKYNAVFNEFSEKINRIRNYDGYKYLLGKNNGLEKQEFKQVKAPPLVKDDFKWPFDVKEVWFKGELVIPAEIAGIGLTGSRITLDHRAMCSSTLFINGKKEIDAKWWITKDIILSNELKAQESFDVTIRLTKIDGAIFYSMPRIFIDKLEPVLLRIDAFFKTLKFLTRLIEIGKTIDKAFISNFENVVKHVPVELLAEEKPLEFIDYIDKTESGMQAFSSYLKKYCSYLIGHAHLDMNWLWDWENTVDTTKRTFMQVEKLMSEYPDFCFSQSQAVQYRIMEKGYPELFKNIKKRVREGRWDVTASTWVEGDLNMASGEALIRQSLLAKQYTREKFGVESKVCWCPDTFGHPATYPQILKKCGIDYYYFCRCGSTAPVFYWEGIDGSKVLAFNDPKGYNGVIIPQVTLKFDRSLMTRRLPPAGGLRDSHKKYHINKHLFSYGVGDHGGGPTRRDIENALMLKDRAVFTGLRFSSAHQFFKDVEKDMKDIPVIKNELNYVFEGCYTTHADIKKYNRECENLLITAEVFASIASLYGFSYPKEALKQAWENTCFNQFHDILDGSAIHSSYEYSKRLAENAIDTAKQTIMNSTGHMSSLIGLPEQKDRIPVVVFNCLSWKRNEVVEISLSGLNMDNAIVEDISGEEIPSQIIGNKLFFYAESVPSIGYKTYFIRKNTEKDNDKVKPEDEMVFENDRYLLEIDPATGGIKRLFNKKKNRELIDNFQQGNIFKLYIELEHSMSSWNIGQIDSVKNLYKNTKIIEIMRGPVVDIVETECKFEKSQIKQQIMFFKKHDRIEFRTKLLWNETGNPEHGIPMLRVSFPMNIDSEKTACEIPFGTIQRPNNGQEMPVLKWIDYSDRDNGVALLNDCKYGCNVQDSNVELTIIRSPYEPDLNPDLGRHSFSYCLYPHEGNWQDADVVKRGYEFNMPLVPVILDIKSLDKKGKALPVEKSFAKIAEGNGVIISCLKKAEDGNGFIMHAYESHGKPAEVEFDFGIKIRSAVETNLIEDKIAQVNIKNNKLNAKLKEWEIKAYKLIK